MKESLVGEGRPGQQGSLAQYEFLHKACEHLLKCRDRVP